MPAELIRCVCPASVRARRFSRAGTWISFSVNNSLADGTCRDLLRTLQLADKKIKAVVTSRVAAWEEFLKAARLGAFDMIAGPCVPTEVEWVISPAVRVLRNERQAARLDGRVPEVQVHS